MTDYLLQHGTRKTPQSEPMRGDQVPNSAGGYSWAVDDWTRLRRFLILGSQGGSYYASERKLSKENIDVIKSLIASDGEKVVAEIVEISDAGRAPQNDPALFALAAAISLGDKPTKKAAAEALPKVARIATHLYHFVAYAETMRGWGRTMRWAVSNWYSRNPEQLAYQAVKYRQRDGWSHRDLLRLAHPNTSDENTAALFAWITHPETEVASKAAIVEGFEAAQASESPAKTAELVQTYGLPREALLTEHLNSVEVWEALLATGMPMHAMVRNLATMTRIGVLDSAEPMKTVLSALDSDEAIRKSRLHPLAVLVAQATYASGQGFRGGNTWNPKPKVIDALNAAFYKAFGNVVPTGKRYLLALDVSGSMTTGQVAGSPLTPREAAAAMALVTLKTEDNVDCVGFYAGSGGYQAKRQTGQYAGWYYGNTGLTPLGLSAGQRLDDVLKVTANLPFGGTDCSLPFAYATLEKKEYDAFIVYTDSETWAGNVHPKQALDEYRNLSGIPARSVVVGMVSNGFTIADPNDAGMMDVVGFDTAAPNLISDFVAGNL